jgi:hypothetical protein
MIYGNALIVKRPVLSIGATTRFLLKRELAALHVQRLEIAARLLPENTQNVETGFVTVTEMPKLHLGG